MKKERKPLLGFWSGKAKVVKPNVFTHTPSTFTVCWKKYGLIKCVSPSVVCLFWTLLWTTSLRNSLWKLLVWFATKSRVHFIPETFKRLSVSFYLANLPSTLYMKEQRQLHCGCPPYGDGKVSVIFIIFLSCSVLFHHRCSTMLLVNSLNWFWNRSHITSCLEE